METIDKSLRRTRMYWELKERYLMKKIEPIVLIALVVWLGFMYQLLTAVTYYAGQRVVIFN